jgi:hypothetical protein
MTTKIPRPRLRKGNRVKPELEYFRTHVVEMAVRFGPSPTPAEIDGISQSLRGLYEAIESRIKSDLRHGMEEIIEGIWPGVLKG